MDFGEIFGPESKFPVDASKNGSKFHFIENKINTPRHINYCMPIIANEKWVKNQRTQKRNLHILLGHFRNLDQQGGLAG